MHQTLNALVVDDLSKVAQRERDTPIAIAALVLLEQRKDLGLQLSVLVGGAQRLLLVLKRAARQAGDLQQAFQRILLP